MQLVSTHRWSESSTVQQLDTTLPRMNIQPIYLDGDFNTISKIIIKVLTTVFITKYYTPLYFNTLCLNSSVFH